MDFPEEQLPQLSELASRLSPITATATTTTTEYTSNENVQSQAAQTSAYEPTADSSYKQTSTNSSTKYTSSLFSWSDLEKQNNQSINIPNLCQNNTLLGLHTNILSPNFMSLYLPNTSQAEITKQEIGVQSEEQRNSDMESQSQLQQNAIMTEYFQKWQATTLPLTLHQLIRMQTEQIKKGLMEEKIEHSQNNILNIPSVPTFRNTQLQNGGDFANADQIMVSVNPNDLNVNLENEQENQNNLQPVVKVEQQIQTDLPKIEKKPKFRAKIGEIKVSVNMNGSMVYCCPECNLAFHDKSSIENHIQAHIQERKYECKECGAMLKRKEHLDQHMRGHSDERPYKCPLCNKAFKRNEHLTRHYVIHSGNKDFTCRVCQKAFSRKDHLNKHTQTHSGIRKNKKKDSFFIDQKDMFDKNADTMPKQEVSYILKDGYLLKQETTFLHQIQNVHKDTNLLSVLSSFRDQAIKDPNMLQQQNTNVDEIMSQNTRHIMPS